MQTITYREKPLAYRRLVNTLFTLATLGVIAWSVYEAWQSSGMGWDPIAAILVLIVWMGALFVMRRASVTLDGRGLTYAIDSTSRHWPWSELSAPEIHSSGGTVPPFIRFRPNHLDWMARLTWWDWRGRPEIRLPQKTYDAPLAEICAKLNEFRDKGLAGDGGAYVETDDRGAKIVVYRERAGSGQWKAIPIFALLCFLFFWSPIVTYWDSGIWSWNTMLYLPCLVIISLGFGQAAGTHKGPRTLKLEDQNLTYLYGTEIIRSWRWTDLSAPEIPRGGNAPYVRLRPGSRMDWVARLFMPGISLDGSEIRVGPIFDAPLATISAMLDEYRDRALSLPAEA